MVQFVFGLLLCVCVAFVKAGDTERIPSSQVIHVLEGGEYSVGFTKSDRVGDLSVSTNLVYNFTVDVQKQDSSTTNPPKPYLGFKGANVTRIFTISLTGNATGQINVTDGSSPNTYNGSLFDDKSVTVYVYPKDSLSIYPESSTIVSEMGSAQRIGYHAHPAIRKCYYQMENGEGGSFSWDDFQYSNGQERGATDFIFTYRKSNVCQIYVTYPKNATELRFTITASNGQTNVSSTNFTLKYYNKWTYQPVVEVKDDVNVNLVGHSGNETLSDCYFLTPRSNNRFTTYYIGEERMNKFTYGLDMDKGVCRIQIKKLLPEHYGLWTCVYKVGFESDAAVSSTFLVKKADSSTS